MVLISKLTTTQNCYQSHCSGTRHYVSLPLLPSLNICITISLPLCMFFYVRHTQDNVNDCKQKVALLLKWQFIIEKDDKVIDKINDKLNDVTGNNTYFNTKRSFIGFDILRYARICAIRYARRLFSVNRLRWADFFKLRMLSTSP